MSEVYHSSTLGPIPLSFTGRRLLQNLREEVQALLKLAQSDKKRLAYSAELMPISADEWKPLSKARGELAKYMSKLEGYQRSPYRELWDSIPGEEPKPAHVNFKCMGEPVTPPVEPPQRTFTVNLPPVPEGYVLEIVGNMLTMRPLVELAVKEGKPPRKKRKRAKR